MIADSVDLDRFDAIVLGAGISGLVATSILLQQGAQNVLVVDEYSHCGGNHIDCQIGDYTFDVGSYIFQDDSPLLAHFPELLPLYVPINPSWGRLTPYGIVTHYPISIRDDLFLAGPVEWFRILSSVLLARLIPRQMANARDFATFWIGARLFDRSGLEHYVDRFYGVPAEKVDIKFAEKRMLWIKEHATLRNLVRKLMSPPKPPTNRQLARPREGFAYLYQRAMERLERQGAKFLLGTKLDRIRKEDDRFAIVAGNREVACRRLVSTIPLTSTQRLCGIAAEDDLHTVTLISLFFSFSGIRGFDQSILYNFSNQGAWKRLTVHSDFYGRCRGREFFAVEVNADGVGGDVAEAERDFREHVARNGLFAGDLHLEGSHTLENAYPIYTKNADERARKAIAELRAFGIESIGRQGGFDYQPTARDSTVKAEAALRSGNYSAQ
ncbi:NAD(P)-binding protein [Bradyrhizobium sp. STM 3562]|uniref:NAD(P)-binding protein n=1 Tax=Bradyrhizobium sp. STM 3562 TaxID=578924 RepID=UPI00388EEA0B